MKVYNVLVLLTLAGVILLAVLLCIALGVPIQAAIYLPVGVWVWYMVYRENMQNDPRKQRFKNRYAYYRREFSGKSKEWCMRQARAELYKPTLGNHPVRGSVSADTRKMLYAMAGGNLGLIERLVDQKRLDLQGCSEQEVWEEVIRNLERDRH